MCGRLTLTRPEQVAEHFELAAAEPLRARYNAAPGQAIASIDRHSEASARGLRLRHWGLVPPWAESPRVGARMINARAETLAERPAFRSAFQRRRCLVPADGFYEWDARRRPAQPYWLQLESGGLFAFAALFERWRDPQGELLESLAIVTTAADASLASLHARKPVILAPADYERWLDPELRATEPLRELFSPERGPSLAMRPVGLRVNDVRVDDASCLEPALPAPRQGSLFGEG